MEKLQNDEKTYESLDCFNRLVDETKNEILALLKNPESMPKYMIDRQLHSILEELNKMRTAIGQFDFYPYYPKGITYCWDYNDNLAKKLMHIAEIYQKLNIKLRRL